MANIDVNTSDIPAAAIDPAELADAMARLLALAKFAAAYLKNPALDAVLAQIEKYLGEPWFAPLLAWLLGMTPAKILEHAEALRKDLGYIETLKLSAQQNLAGLSS